MNDKTSEPMKMLKDGSPGKLPVVKPTNSRTNNKIGKTRAREDKRRARLISSGSCSLSDGLRNQLYNFWLQLFWGGEAVWFAIISCTFGGDLVANRPLLLVVLAPGFIAIGFGIACG